MKKILQAAAKLPPAKARRIVAAIVAAASDPSDPADPSDLSAALAEDLRPLGLALEASLAAGDMPAMRAALQKITARMPDFLNSPTLTALFERDFSSALSQ